MWAVRDNIEYAYSMSKESFKETIVMERLQSNLLNDPDVKFNQKKFNKYFDTWYRLSDINKTDKRGRIKK